jgi:hypothetical protein
MVTGVMPLTKFMSSIADNPAAVYLIKINFLMLNTAVVDPIRVGSTSKFFCLLLFEGTLTTFFNDKKS